MKQATDPRHLDRIKRFKKLFNLSFKSDQFDPEIDATITKLAPDWPIAKLNKVDLAILRLAISELKNNQKIPPKVVIDEAIEIGKTYGSTATPKFINGVLARLIKHD